MVNVEYGDEGRWLDVKGSSDPFASKADVILM